MKSMNQTGFTKFYSNRKFGIELEVCSYDDRDFKEVRLAGNEMPLGIDDVALTIMKGTCEQVIINKWHLTHNNTQWVLKPDSSCGIEICSPILAGVYGMRKLVSLISILKSNRMIHVDHRCGFHLHTDISDTGTEGVGAILAWWIKCEAVFLDAMPDYRKVNRYCQQIGGSPLFEHDLNYTSQELIKKLGQYKYFTVNSYHYYKGNRPTIEFRVAEDTMCLNEIDAENWVCLLLHFIEMAKKRGMPLNYQKDNQRTGLCWMDFNDVMSFLQFDGELCPKLLGVKNWFTKRIINNTCDMKGIWSKEARNISFEQAVNYLNSGT